MKVFVIGDYRTGTGPANVTKEYLLRLPKGTMRLIATSKLVRAIEIAIKMPFASVVLCSGYSAQNVFAMKLAHKFNKKTAYLCHGCVEHENSINGQVNAKMNQVERETLRRADMILAVSKRFAQWLKTFYPEYSDKIDYVTNGVDFDALDELVTGKNIKRDSHMLLTVGGGMPRKQIKHICKAVELLNREWDLNYRLVVVGDKGNDDEIINECPYVDNLGLVSSKKMYELYRRANIFIQNSCFETFGLAPMEALMCGANVLLSKEIGALDLITVNDGDIINNWYDEQEIKNKIDRLLDCGNSARLSATFNRELSSWRARTEQLCEKLIWLMETAKQEK